MCIFHQTQFDGQSNSLYITLYCRLSSGNIKASHKTFEQRVFLKHMINLFYIYLYLQLPVCP